MLTGRRIVMGYRGWLWTHGIDYRTLERAVAAMYAGDPGSEALFARYGVTHIYVGPGERAALHANLDRLRARHPRVFLRGDVEVFDVRREPALAARVGGAR
jgi:uncharacterized membrane protein